ncbi:MAG: tRNA lysidine(34) synthetase TilS [Cyanobacteria bacterium HKST-UBA03]|nr:tRNA lysidine(34) synthetase TilS [Cyanobacteria bacterium HKST-UBA03]
MMSAPTQTPTMLSQVQQFLEQHHLLGQAHEAHYVVAFSGGRDSTVLLHCLKQLQAHYPRKIRLTAVYYCHPWRPLQNDLAQVHKTCKALEVDWICLAPDLTIAHTEESAREDRYNQLARLALDLDATAILTAHHQDDSLETVLFRLFRGTGIEGLNGIPPIRTLYVDEGEVVVARPLLAVSRQAINEVVSSFSLAYVDDPTNQQTQFSRNKLRHLIIPHLETTFPDWRQSMMKLTEHARFDTKIIQAKMDDVWQMVYQADTDSLDERRFLQLDEAYQRRVLRHYLRAHDQEYSYQRIIDALCFLRGEQGRTFGPGLFSVGTHTFLSVYRHRITLETRQPFEVEPLDVSVPCRVSHRQFRATLIIKELDPEERIKPYAWHKTSNFDLVVNLKGLEDATLTLRNRRQGDFITPLGMAENIKLKKLFKNRGISRFHRDRVPLLAQGSKVLWVAGLGLNEEIRVKSKPTHRITFEQTEEPVYMAWKE